MFQFFPNGLLPQVLLGHVRQRRVRALLPHLQPVDLLPQRSDLSLQLFIFLEHFAGPQLVVPHLVLQIQQLVADVALLDQLRVLADDSFRLRLDFLYLGVRDLDDLLLVDFHTRAKEGLQPVYVPLELSESSRNAFLEQGLALMEDFGGLRAVALAHKEMTELALPVPRVVRFGDVAGTLLACSHRLHVLLCELKMARVYIK